MQRIPFAHGWIVLVTVLTGCQVEDTPDAGWDGIVDSATDGDDAEEEADLPEADVIPEVFPDSTPEDNDGDGYRPADGDCQDWEPRVNPGAYDDPDNEVDDDCDTVQDNPVDGCDCVASAWFDEAMGLCDDRFVRAVTPLSYAPDSHLGRGVREHYGSPGNDLDTREGCQYAVLSTGLVDPVEDVCDNRQPGTDFRDPDGMGMGCYETGLEPDPDPTGGSGVVICDVEQLVVDLTAPTNALSFSFDFIYLSTEYPEWVDEGFNDTFYAILERPSTGEVINISFDDLGNEIEVDNAFFESPPVTDLGGTGYSDDSWGEVCGSSTGWLRTSWDIDPGEQFTVRFSIHDEGDGIYDSMVIIDNFQWHLDPADPGTIII